MKTKKKTVPKIKKKTEWSRIKAFFADPLNHDVVSISGVERAAGIKPKRLYEALRGREVFSQKYEENTIKILTRFGMKDEEED